MRRLPGVGVGRSNGPVTVEDPVALLDRRAALLEGRGDPGELDEVTSALRSALDGVEPAVRRITADEPGDLLVRLAQDEPVHPVRSPEDLANRLADDRRCYVLEHPTLPPLRLSTGGYVFAQSARLLGLTAAERLHERLLVEQNELFGEIWLLPRADRVEPLDLSGVSNYDHTGPSA